MRTSAQLDGLRERLGVGAGAFTWWASATLDTRLLDTPDAERSEATIELQPQDRQTPEVQQRVSAVKRLAKLPFHLAGESGKQVAAYVEQLAAAVAEKHQPHSTTLVILNRVNRAKDLFSALGKVAKKRTLPAPILVHSRFRLLEREELFRKLKEPAPSEGKIIVATQAVEAGVDISSRTLMTEVAPWSSLVQRFGRCHRKGEYHETGGADIYWLDLVPEDEKVAVGLALPYTPEQLASARTLLSQAEPSGAAPAALESIRSVEPLPPAHILRRKDLVDLFDTTPDLAGLDVDVGRFIRDEDDRDVQVFWRDFEAKEAPDEGIEPLAKELVRVPWLDFDTFAKENKGKVWLWSVLDGGWQTPDRITPGQIYLVQTGAGGYSERLGWTGKKEKEPFRVLSLEDQPLRRPARDGQGRDDQTLVTAGRSSTQGYQSLEWHTDRVVQACQRLLEALPASAPWSAGLLAAAKWHDFGKTHACFQRFVNRDRADIPQELQDRYLAKASWKEGARHERPHFRHELASALAWLQAGPSTDAFLQSLVAYLVASHHGKVRLSIRSMPGETPAPSENGQGDRLFARGIWDGDRLPGDSNRRLSLDGLPAESITLDLSCMLMGEQDEQPSWTARALALRDHPQLGVFRLAWLETLLRAADAQGSKE